MKLYSKQICFFRIVMGMLRLFFFCVDHKRSSLIYDFTAEFWRVHGDIRQIKKIFEIWNIHVCCAFVSSLPLEIPCVLLNRFTLRVQTFFSPHLSGTSWADQLCSSITQLVYSFFFTVSGRVGGGGGLFRDFLVHDFFCPKLLRLCVCDISIQYKLFHYAHTLHLSNHRDNTPKSLIRG